MVTKSKLSEPDVQSIIINANDQLIKNSKYNDIIGDQVFKLLEQNCRVLYYPLEDDDVWGFIERVRGQLFACINTSIPYEKQIFAAAHELYHIWYDKKNAQEIIISANLEENGTGQIDINEQKANRFAAEFLAETKLLNQEMARYGIIRNKIAIKEVLQLCDIFTIPYKTMARRLYEINAVDNKTLVNLLAVTEEEITVWKNILGITAPVKQDYIRLDNLVKKSVELFEMNLITYEKLEYLLEYVGMSPLDVGITKPEHISMSDDEIAEILGEDDD